MDSMQSWDDIASALTMVASAAEVTGEVPLYFGLMYWLPGNHPELTMRALATEGDEVAVHSRSWDVIGAFVSRLLAQGVTNVVITTHPLLPPCESFDLDTLPPDRVAGTVVAA